MELFQSKSQDSQKLNEDNLYNCRWNQEVNKSLVCVNIKSSLCGKKCTIKESECNHYKNRLNEKKNEKDNKLCI